MQRARLPYLLIPLAAFIAIVPLLVNGCSCGHDFDFHLLNWLEAARQFTHGNLHPHWAYTPAYNAGEPRFVFYPPLSWTIGAILGLLLPWTWTPIIYTWLALTAAGFSLHYLAREFTTPTAATLAAILYTVNPYTLFTAYERTAYAELLAAAFIPLLLHAILRKQVTIPRIAIPIALLWLTNAPAAVMSCYALALLTLIRLATNSSNQLPPAASNTRSTTKPAVIDSSNRLPPVASNNRTPTSPGAPYLDSEMWASRASATAPAHSTLPNAPSQTPRQLALNTIAGTTLGLGLAAFYILPAAYERRYVQIAMAIIPNMRIQDNFLFHHTGDIDHDHVLHTASIIAVILLAFTFLIVLVLAGQKRKASSRPDPERAQRVEGVVERPPHFVNGDTASNIDVFFAPITILTLAITLLLTPLTKIIWTHAPELLFLQFPWRLLAILAAVLALAIALALTPLKLKPTQTTILTILIATALTYPAYATFHQTCDPEDTVQSRVLLFHSNQGTDPTDEYTPITADNDSLAHTNPPWWLSSDPNAKAPANTQPGPTPTRFSIKATQPGFLILNLRDYPSWDVTTVDPNSMALQRPKHMQRDDGLISLRLYYPSDYTIDITYTQSADQTLGYTISLVALAILLFMLFRKSRKISSGPFSS
jgi:hypothetical protein